MSGYMTVKDVADYLRIARHTVYKMVRLGEIPMAQLPTARGNDICGHYRIRREVLDQWVTDRMWANVGMKGTDNG